MKRSRKDKDSAAADAARGAPKAKASEPSSFSAGDSSTKRSSYLSKVLHAMDVARGPDGSFILQNNPIQTRSKLTRIFDKYCAGRNGFVDSMLENLDTQCSADAAYMEALLSPCFYVTQENGPPAKMMQSLFNILLAAPQFQPVLLRWLIEKIPMEECDSDTSKRRLRLMLDNLRFLTSLEDSQLFAKQVMDCLNGCAPAVQRELIGVIPEVIDDKGHLSTVETLENLMEEDSSFTSAILDTFSSLNLAPKILDSVREKLLKRLDSTPPDHLPVLIKFLFQTTPPKGMAAVVGHLRADLDLTTDLLQSHVKSQHATTLHQKDTRAHSYQLLTLESIRTAMSFDEKIATTFLSAISADADNTPFDVWVVLMAHGMPKLRVKVEALVKRKVLAREWSVRLLKRALSKHGDLLQDHFHAALALAERGVRSASQLHVSFGCQLYFVAFGVFTRPFEQQEVLTNVLSHVGSHNDVEAGAGLDVLLDMTREPAQLKMLWSFVETVLDHLAAFSRANSRKAWAMFAALMWDDRERGLLDQKIFGTLDMVARKQLSNTRHAYKCSGIVGAVALLAELAVQPGAELGGQCAPTKTKEVAEHFHTTWGNLLQHCSHEAPYMALAMDELAHAFQHHAHARAAFNTNLDVLAEQLLEQFETFVVTVDANKRRAKANVVPVMDLNGAMDAGTAVDVWERTGDLKKRDALLYLCPLFRAVQTVHRCNTHDLLLHNLEALLGAPLLLYPEGSVESFKELGDAVQQRVCSALFFGINWLREVVGAFCAQPDAAAHAKVLQRLTHMHQLEHQLEMCLRAMPMAAGSQCAFLPNAQDPAAALGELAAAPSSKKKSKVSEKQSAAKEDGDGGGGGGGGSDDLVRVRSMHARFRFLDLDVVRIFSYASLCDSNAGSVCWLRSFALHQLVTAVHAMCDALLAPPKKPTPFGRKTTTGTSPALSSRWAGQTLDALDTLLLPAIPALNEHLQRLCSAIKEDDQDQWSFDADQRYDHDAAVQTAKLENEADEEDARALRRGRQRMEFWWYVIPTQRMLLEVFELVLRWLQTTSVNLPAEEAKAYDRLARRFLEALVPPLQPGSAGSASAGLRKDAYNYLVCFSPSIQTLPSAVAFVRVLEIVVLYGASRKFLQPLAVDSPDAADDEAGAPAAVPQERALLQGVSSSCATYLQRSWPAGGAKAADVRLLVELFLQHSRRPTSAASQLVLALEKLVGVAANVEAGAAADEDEGAAAVEWPTLTKATLSLFYKCIFQSLIRQLKAVDFAKHEMWSVQQQQLELKRARKCNSLMRRLVMLCKEKVPMQVQVLALREGKLYVEQLQRALPFLSCSIKGADAAAVKLLLRSAQQGTRVMQAMCAQAKSEGEKALLSLVPATKKALQKFVLEMRRCMDSAGLSSVLELGPLKHKDVQGNEVSSQVTYGVDVSEEQQEEEEEGEQQQQQQQEQQQQEQQEDEEDAEENQRDGIALVEEEEEEEEEEGAGSEELLADSE